MDINALFLRKKFWFYDFIFGSPIGKPYKEIEYISEHSCIEGQVIREQKLKDILNFAIKNCPFYYTVKSDNLSDFPIMNKSKYIDSYNQIRVPEDKISHQNGTVHIQRTSGSTGTPFAVPQDTMKRQRRIAELKYFGRIVGFNTHEKLIHLRAWNKWQEKTTKQIKSENIIPFDISELSDDKLEELRKLIIESNAICLRGYASSFDIIAKYVIEHPIEHSSLKICIAGSEALHDNVRALVKKYLNCEIISQYANEECGILAQERIPTKESDNVMYFNNAGYYFEFLKMDSDEPAEFGELCRIVITDFHNHAFPIIRYDNGDVGIISKPDEFSNGYPVLQKLYGRRLDVCYTTDNIPLSPMVIGRILKHYEDISQWQFIQKSQNEYVLKVIMRNEISAVDYLQSPIGILKKHLGQSAIISIEQVNDIPVLNSGKRKSVINEWKK
mgnify:CR=1 FL=1